VVKAVNAVGESDPSNEAHIFLPTTGNQSGGNQSGGNQSGGNQSGGYSPPTGSVLVPAISAGVGILVIIGSVIAVRRLRARPRPPLVPQPTVRVVRDAGPPSGVRVRPTGTQPTVAVRIEPHPGAITTLIEEMQR
jgi:hypothetical protein